MSHRISRFSSGRIFPRALSLLGDSMGKCLILRVKEAVQYRNVSGGVSKAARAEQSITPKVSSFQASETTYCSFRVQPGQPGKVPFSASNPTIRPKPAIQLIPTKMVLAVKSPPAALRGSDNLVLPCGAQIRSRACLTDPGVHREVQYRWTWEME